MHSADAAAAAAALGAALGAAVSLLLLQLLLADAVRHCVPDVQMCCWFIGSDSSVFFLLIQTWLSFKVPLGSILVAFTASILPIRHPR